MTITRTWLNATLPAGEHLEDLAFMFSGSRHMDHQLEWLAHMNDIDDMFPAWTKPGVEVSRYHDRWHVTMDGLSYKDRRGYLTAEEWYAGMTCWYVCIECGWREFIAAETPDVAVQRAVVFMRMTIDRRDTHPDDRSNSIQTDIKNLWAKGHNRTKYAVKGLFMIAEHLLRLAERQEAYNNGERP